MKTFFLFTVGLLTASGASSVVWAQPGSGPYYGHGSHMWDVGPWMFIGPLMMIGFLAAIVAVFVLVVRWFGGPGHVAGQHPSPDRTPLDILKERLARGEIDKEEYEERRRILGE